MCQPSALEAAQERIEQEIRGVTVLPQVKDYTHGLELDPATGERRLVLYIGSSIGNFEPEEADELLRRCARRIEAGRCAAAGSRPGEGRIDAAGRV